MDQPAEHIPTPDRVIHPARGVRDWCLLFQATVRARLVVVRDMAMDTTIHEPGEPIRAVLFPLTGVASQLVATAEGDLIEVGTIGREGLVGLAAFHHADGGPLRAIAQIPGAFLRLPVSILHERAAPGAALNALLHRYSQAFYTLAAQSAGCNRLHPLEERCARWLLLTHDRVGADTFPLTHEYLGYMLGVRRPSVTIALAALQRAGLISYHRGEVTIANRPALELVACTCYAIITAEYDRLLV